MFGENILAIIFHIKNFLGFFLERQVSFYVKVFFYNQLECVIEYRYLRIGCVQCMAILIN